MRWAAPQAFDVTLEIIDDAGMQLTTATVKEGVEATITLKKEQGVVLRELRLRVVGIDEKSARLMLKMTDASTGQPSETLMELEYGKTGSMRRSGSAPAMWKATIQKLATDQARNASAL